MSLSEVLGSAGKELLQENEAAGLATRQGHSQPCISCLGTCHTQHTISLAICCLDLFLQTNAGVVKT